MGNKLVAATFGRGLFRADLAVVNTPPTISNIVDQTTPQNTPDGPIAFIIGDAETAPASLTVSGGSSNTTLVPNANITFGGSGANRTVTTPAANQTGTATITVTVSDGTLTAQDTFVQTVTPAAIRHTPGDYDGNGTTDMAVFRPSSSTWFIRNGTSASWGAAADIPVPGDYDGNGTTDMAVFRPSQGIWYVRNGTNAQWGASADRPQPGDYDGNGTTDEAVFRPSDTVWYVQAGTSAQWGASTDIQLSLPYAIRRVFFP